MNFRPSAIYLSPAAPVPVQTAANELAAAVGGSVVTAAPASWEENRRAIALVTGAELRRWPAAWARLGRETGGEWELIEAVGQWLVMAGATPRNVCHAALAWLAAPERETGRLSRYRFSDRFTMWDNTMNQMYRFSRGFDRTRHIRELARLGLTGIEVNRYADEGGWHVRHRRYPNDPYPWYMSYAPALDAFVESTVTRGVFDPEELRGNLADLQEAAGQARRYGLQPGFVCYEPRGTSEGVFDRYPELRGSRIDHPGRSLQPRYALDIANPRVLDHYAESLTRLMEAVPDLRYFVYWTQDSGSGLPFACRLYPGPNGSYLARSKSIEQINAEFTGALVQAGRKINPEFEVIMEIGHEYIPEERARITAQLPAGVTLSHPMDFDESGLKDGHGTVIETYVREDRAVGVEPYATITIAAGWDPEPIVAVPSPRQLAKKFPRLDRIALRRHFVMGGTFAPPWVPFSINQELYAELIRDEHVDLEEFLRAAAARVCGGENESARALVAAWKLGDDALESWPKLNWYAAGPGQTQARWLTRPLVPDLTRLTPQERSAWERALFTCTWDIARVNVVFEGGIRMFEDEQFEQAVRAYDTQTIPLLEDAVRTLDTAFRREGHPLLEDQRDRYQGFLLRCRSDRNLFEAQVAINNVILGRGEGAAERRRLRAAILADLATTEAWIRALETSGTNFFRITDRGETPFQHKTPVADLQLKLTVMRAHIDDEPGPVLAELRETKRKRLQFSAIP
jgi:hypothetical protein